MRLIDADELKTAFPWGQTVRTECVRATIDHMPTIEPERKGKWKETDDGWDGTYYVCSECGCPWTLIDGTPFDNGMNYCPNCGSKMEVKNE